MNIVGLTLSCMFVMLFTINSSQKAGWRGIIPLHSTRAQVERLIGSPIKPDGLIYDLATENVFIEYSSGPCKKDKPGGYNVARDTVVQIRVSSSTPPLFSDLNLDLSRYEKTPDPELPGVLHYSNMEEGIAYEVQNGKVTSTNYFPSADDRHLRCPDSAAKKLCDKQ